MSDAFAAKAAQWDANPLRAAVGQAFHAQVRLAVAEYFADGLAGRTVLDFGCGTGVQGLHLAADNPARLLFVDTSPAMLEVLRGKLADAQSPQMRECALVHEGPLEALPAPAASVDLAVSLMALHHIEDAHGALRSLRGLLKPGGLLLLGDLLPEDGSFHASAAVDSSGDPPAEHNGFDPETLRTDCESLGFAVLRLLPFHLLRKPDATGAVREYPLFFLAARAARAV
ncbi:MAG TPA: class I SAM-dependent methyltransferase [Humidesulfovibrio sp.]|uniref:class I SAM-dependent methyltransferase n=1 Tax=Humidesulfovibrio sp. TaxID=2910988 RepID=UPI002CCB0B2E|nr:class I SAM-dependent methyltransferase [Humidesulfovibrio sp.]HWR04347.1 class I SAM-dependent methyltransferase [Humidesulfovibrio sp.]